MFCHKQTDFDNFTLQQGKYFASQIREIIFEKAVSEFFHLPLFFWMTQLMVTCKMFCLIHKHMLAAFVETDLSEAIPTKVTQDVRY